jgi:Lar family restriction alleviation protein
MTTSPQRQVREALATANAESKLYPEHPGRYADELAALDALLAANPPSVAAAPLQADLHAAIQPCPFCGSANLRVFNAPDEHGRDSFGVQCCGSECSICGPQRGSQAEAIADWNRRDARHAAAELAAAASPAMPRLVDAARAVIAHREEMGAPMSVPVWLELQEAVRVASTPSPASASVPDAQDRTGCTAGTDEECTFRKCATACPALKAAQPAAPAGAPAGPVKASDEPEIIRMVWRLRSAIRDDSGAGASREAYSKAIEAEETLIAAIRTLLSAVAPAAPLLEGREPSGKLLTLMDVTLEGEAADTLRTMLGTEDDVAPVRLLYGDGHSGPGLYAAAAEYQEEGATLLVAAPLPAAQPEAGWRNVEQDGMPPCDGETVFIGINSAGYPGCFNAMESTSVGGNTCFMDTAEDRHPVMSELRWWRALVRPGEAGAEEARDAARFAAYFTGRNKDGDPAPLLELELRVINGDYPSLDEWRSAIDKTMSATLPAAPASQSGGEG